MNSHWWFQSQISSENYISNKVLSKDFNLKKKMWFPDVIHLKYIFVHRWCLRLLASTINLREEICGNYFHPKFSRSFRTFQLSFLKMAALKSPVNAQCPFAFRSANFIPWYQRNRVMIKVTLYIIFPEKVHVNTIYLLRYVIRNLTPRYKKRNTS